MHCLGQSKKIVEIHPTSGWEKLGSLCKEEGEESVSEFRAGV
jgi:hypothetical protein